jgi:hypothetical protein
MRSAHGLTSFLGTGPARRMSCGRCGDSFTGRAGDGRTWLEAHVASEHGTPSVTPVRLPLEAPTASRTPQLVPSV